MYFFHIKRTLLSRVILYDCTHLEKFGRRQNNLIVIKLLEHKIVQLGICLFEQSIKIKTHHKHKSWYL